MTSETTTHPALKEMVSALEAALGDALLSVVLYGSAARGDFEQGASDLNLILVLEDLEPATLERLTGPLRGWDRRRQPVPRLLTPALIREAADVFPIELLDIRQRRVVLHGADHFAAVDVSADAALRLQCERELREKMMRLREAYAREHASARELRRLLSTSYSTFLALFRGCLHLLGDEVPTHNTEVLARFCAKAGLHRGPFDAIERLRHAGADEPDLKGLFARYYAELTKAVQRVDRFDADRDHQPGQSSR